MTDGGGVGDEFRDCGDEANEPCEPVGLYAALDAAIAEFREKHPYPPDPQPMTFAGLRAAYAELYSVCEGYRAELKNDRAIRGSVMDEMYAELDGLPEKSMSIKEAIRSLRELVEHWKRAHAAQLLLSHGKDIEIEQWQRQEDLLKAEIARRDRRIVDADAEIKQLNSDMDLDRQEVIRARAEVERLEAQVETDRECVAERNATVKQLQAAESEFIDLARTAAREEAAKIAESHAGYHTWDKCSRTIAAAIRGGVGRPDSQRVVEQYAKAAHKAVVDWERLYAGRGLYSVIREACSGVAKSQRPVGPGHGEEHAPGLMGTPRCDYPGGSGPKQ